jgi:hypothetical protein
MTSYSARLSGLFVVVAWGFEPQAVRSKCGKLAENIVVTDRLTEYRQLGVITDDELATAEEPTAATPMP